MDLNLSLYVRIGLYSTLCILMGPKVSLYVIMCLNGSLMGRYASIWNGSLLVPMRRYGSLVSFYVFMRPKGSLGFLIGPYASLWDLIKSLSVLMRPYRS